jgi:protein TonB
MDMEKSILLIVFISVLMMPVSFVAQVSQSKDSLKIATDVEEPDFDCSFPIIEDAPVFPGCKGNMEETKKCTFDQIHQIVIQNFNVKVADSTGIKGKVRVYVSFKIDQKGQVTDIVARAPHQKLETEAVRVISLLPVFRPGKQRGMNVSVKFNLPIVFIID